MIKILSFLNYYYFKYGLQDLVKIWLPLLLLKL